MPLQLRIYPSGPCRFVGIGESQMKPRGWHVGGEDETVSAAFIPSSLFKHFCPALHPHPSSDQHFLSSGTWHAQHLLQEAFLYLSSIPKLDEMTLLQVSGHHYQEPSMKLQTMRLQGLSQSVFNLQYLTLKESESVSLSRVRLFATPWTVARQVPLPMAFSRQEYQSGLMLGRR